MAFTDSLTSAATNLPVPLAELTRAQLQASPLRIDAADEAQPETDREAEIPLGDRVLIVDDDEDSLMVAQYAVESFGYQAIAVLSGHDAVVAALTHAPDIILLDILLDGLNGIDVLHHLRENGVRVPVIAVTAVAHSHSVEGMLAAGFTDCVTKPYMMEDLYLVMARSLIAANIEEPSVWPRRAAPVYRASEFPYCTLPCDSLAG